MDYIFKEWEKRLSAFESCVEKDLEEMRKCKAQIQQMQLNLVAEIKKGRYIYDEQRLVLSAPEIIIGHVDRSGNLLSGGSSVVVRGANVGLQGAGDSGQLVFRAPSIHQIAEDPGIDGNEHVVGSLSEVVSQARNIVIQSDDAEGAFSALAESSGGSGVRIHADKTIDIHAAMTAESRETELDAIIKGKEEQQKNLKEQASDCKSSFQELSKELEQLLKDKEKLAGDVDDVRSNYADIQELSEQIEACSTALTEQTYAYAEVLSLLAETNRQIKCFKDEKSKIVKGEDFKQNTTGAKVNITGENISLVSADGENNLRDNEGSGITMLANSVGIAAVEYDGKLKEKGQVRIQAKNVEVATAGMADMERDDDDAIAKATYTAEGDFKVKSKNITIEGVDYEVADKKLKEKQLTDDSHIKLRAKTIEVSTEGSANVEVDEEGKLTKANYTSEGDIIIRSKTVTVESIDTDIENGEAKEKALTAEGKVSIRAEKMDLSATDTEGKATGSIDINAKAVSMKSMDVDPESKDDTALAGGSKMVLVSEEMLIGAQSEEVKSKKVETMSEEIGIMADNNITASGNKVDVTGETKITGETTVDGNATMTGNTEVKGEVKAPKATIDNVEVKRAFKSPNIQDGM